MISYIKITKEFSDLLSQLNYSLAEIEVKGESVKHLYNARILIKQMIESPISEEEILKEKNNIKEE